MKKIFILAAAVFLGVTSFAQRSIHAYAHQLNVADINSDRTISARITSYPGDTVILENSSDTLAHTLYSLGADSGFVYGTNYWNDKAFAERYDVSDSSHAMQVVGVMSLFGGSVNSASANAVTFKVWDQGPQQFISGSEFYKGFPNNIVDSVVVPFTHLGIGAADTLKKFFFTSSTPDLHSAFFIGYSVNYNFLTLAGDTIGLASTPDSVRHPSTYYTFTFNTDEFGDTTVDKIINVQNATLGSDNQWYDNYTWYDSIYNNLAIYPIVIMGFPAGTSSITRNSLTFYGNYPNPSATSTNIRFSLNTATGVTVQVMDISGKILQTENEKQLSAGEHNIALVTSSLPDGDYLYLIRTSSGDGIAGKMTVAH